MIVFLHGFGANAQDLAPFAPYLNLPNYHFLFAAAPFPHPQVPGGLMWYELGNNFEFNLTQLQQSREKLTAWLRSLSSSTGIPLEKTILVGFSQGGAMTLEVGLSLPLAGLIVLSGYLHPQQIAPTAPFPPVLMIHGTQDYVVPVSAARKSQERLLEWGVKVQYSEFPMGHEIPPKTLPLLREFMIHQTSLRDNDNS